MATSKAKKIQTSNLQDQLLSVIDLFIDRDEPEIPRKFQLSLSIDTDDMLKIDALAAVARVSRNSLVSEFLKLAIATTVSNLPKEIWADVEIEYNKALEAAKEGK